MKINWPESESGFLIKLNQSTVQMEHFMSFNKLNIQQYIFLTQYSWEFLKKDFTT